MERVERVDSMLRVGRPSSPSWANFVTLVTIILWAGAAYYIARVLLVPEVRKSVASALAVVGDLLVRSVHIWALTVVLLFAIGVIGAFIFLLLVRKLAREIALALLVLPFVGFGALGIYLMLRGALTAGAVVLVVVVLIGALVLKAMWGRVALVGRMIEVSATAVASEPGTVGAVLLGGILSSLTFIFGLVTSVGVAVDVYLATGNIIAAVIVFLVLMFLTTWAYCYVMYYFDAVAVAIVHDWYRSPDVDVASFSRGRERVGRVKGSVALFALAHGAFRFLIMYARSRREKGLVAAILEAILGVAYEVFRFITFYTLPAIVIHECDLEEGIKRSWDRLKNWFLETLSAAIFVSPVLWVIGALACVIYGLMGFAMGYFWLGTTLAVQPVIAGAIGALLALLFGGFIVMLVVRAIVVAFKTLLYEFTLDIEFASRGITLPTRLPSDLQVQFAEIIREKTGVRVAVPVVAR